ncbi:phosphomannomutase/phosphoglucomutase [Candidatus Saccharibacteria bacterium]|nr:MAG: phosphomannomutase/phosphoglucomutase [Candidatus Saccharibacteria bacterium]
MGNLANIFKAYDIRGRVGTELSEDLVERVGQSFAQWLPSDGSVVVGHDMRPDSRQLADALARGITLAGRDVIDIGLVTSDMAVFGVEHFQAAGAAIITASHNPGEYNGIKLFDSTPKTIGLDQGLDVVRDGALNQTRPEVAASTGSVTHEDLIEAWVDYCLGFVDTSRFKPINIAIDCGNGMAGVVLEKLLARLPFTVERLYFEPDGTFPNHEANPQKLETLKDLQAAVQKKGCYLGVAFDGDGDRMAMIDETGRPITGSEMMSLLASKYLQTPEPSFVYEVRTSRAVVSRLESQGYKGVRSKAGRSNIGEVMRANNAVFGGETTGHFFFKDYWSNDSGMLSMLIALEQVFTQDRPLSEVVSTSHTTNPMIPETNFEVADPKGMLQKVSEAFGKYEQDWLDGLSVTLPDGWFNLRASNTEPVMRLNAEAMTQADLDGLVKWVTEIITN